MADADLERSDLERPETEPDESEGDEKGEPTPGGNIVALSWASTIAFTLAATIATAFPDQAARPVAVFDCLLFVGGIAAFLLAYAQGISRSRTEQIEIGGLFFLTGETAPSEVRRRLLASFGVQVVVALVSSSIRLYTSVAFGILVPMLGLGLAGLWGARHGRFPARAPGPS